MNIEVPASPPDIVVQVAVQQARIRHSAAVSALQQVNILNFAFCFFFIRFQYATHVN